MRGGRRPLSEVLTRIERPARVDASETYSMLGVRWYGEGLFVRERLPGSEIAAKTVYEVREGDFIYNRLFAWKGSFAVAGPEVAGCHASNEFPSFVVNRELAEPRFLAAYFRHPTIWDEALRDSTGGTPTSRNRLKEEKLLQLEVPLPPLDEQRSCVARLDGVNTRLAEARRLSESNTERSTRLLVALAHRHDLSDAAKRASGWRHVRLGDVMKQVENLVTVEPTAEYPNVGMYSFGRGLFRKPAIRGSDTSATRLNRICAGQFIYSRLFAFEGSYGYVPPEFDGAFVSGEYPTFACEPNDLLAEFLFAHLKSPDAWGVLGQGSKGLGDRRQRVQPSTLLEHRLWLPPMSDQRALKAILDRTSQIDAVRETAAKGLNALGSAILTSAFGV